MVGWKTAERAKELGVKLVVRLDNVPRNSRNRNTGTSRLKGFAQMADEVVWQCYWARGYLFDYVGKEGVIIYNGVDLDIFKPEGAYMDFGRKENIYIYSRFNRDETKNWEVAWYEFQLIYRENPNAKLVIVGKFSPETKEYNFDFFRGEKLDFRGIIIEPEIMARTLRGCSKMLAVYYNDCFSNTYLEALACGVKLTSVNMSGGTPEILELFKNKGIEYFSLERVAKDYEKVFEKVLNKVNDDKRF